MHKPLFNNTKVRQVMFCGECFKSQCIFAVSNLRMEEEIIVERVKEAKTYSCGSSLFLLDSPLHDTIVIRQNCCCADPVEGVYHTATLKKFPPVCDMTKRGRLECSPSWLDGIRYSSHILPPQQQANADTMSRLPILHQQTNEETEEVHVFSMKRETIYHRRHTIDDGEGSTMHTQSLEARLEGISVLKLCQIGAVEVCSC